MNQVMGQPSTSGDLTIDADVIRACLGDHRNADRCEFPTVLGADPGGSATTGAIIHVCALRHLRDGRHLVIRVGHVVGWQALHDLMSLLNVQVAVVDGAHDPTKGREFCEAFPGRVWLAYYLTQPVKGDAPVKPDRKTRTLNLDRTATLDLSASRLLQQQDMLPLCDAATHQEMVLQLTAMQRGEEIGADGLPRAYWQETRPDHLRHAHNYATVAALYLASFPSLPEGWAGMGPVPGHEVTGLNVETGQVETRRLRAPSDPPSVAGSGRPTEPPGDLVARMYPALKRKPPAA
jgi:hypothetical protein